MHPDSQLAEEQGLNEKTLRQIKYALIAFVVLLLGILVFFIAKKLSAAKTGGRWDELARLQERYEAELGQEPLLADPSGVYQERRTKYVQHLETFLTTTAAEEDDALMPHVHWLIAKITTDQILTMHDDLDSEKRSAYYDRAIRHLTALRDEFPDFQTNWLGFTPDGAREPTLTRLFLSTLENNRAWEAKYFPKAAMPKDDPVVVIRTERGDMRIGLFEEQAPGLSKLFLERVRHGAYDGTAFFAKVDQGTKDDPIIFAIQGGHPATQGSRPFDVEQHSAFGDDETFEPLMPEASRYQVGMDRGVVVAWHDMASPYDGAATFAVLTGRSPRLDHVYTPIGRLLDDASLMTADRVFGGPTWGDATEGPPPPNLAMIRDFLRAPVRIVKVLAYRNGQLLDAAGEAVTTKAEADTSEQTLASVKPDAYSKDAPKESGTSDTPADGTEGD